MIERRFRRLRHGFSLVELLVLIAIVVVLLSIFVPYIGKVRESDRRVRCTDNLRAISRALQAYANTNPDKPVYPHVRQSPVQPASYTAYSNPDVPDPFHQTNGVKANDVTASLWLMVRAGLIEPYQFICPSTDNTPDPMLTDGKRVAAAQRSNFTSGQHLSYSYSSPFSASKEYALRPDLLPPDFAVVADKNPGVSGGDDAVTQPAYDADLLKLAVANSNNHGGAGQNVLFAQGHVEWAKLFKQTPYCGYGREWYRDNIYTAYAEQPLAEGVTPAPQAQGVWSREVGPAWKYDSFLVPTDDE